jgi:hypothetical protein
MKEEIQRKEGEKQRKEKGSKRREQRRNNNKRKEGRKSQTVCGLEMSGFGFCSGFGPEQLQGKESSLHQI